MLKRKLSAYAYTPKAKRFKPAIKPMFPSYSRPSSVSLKKMTGESKYCDFQINSGTAQTAPTGGVIGNFLSLGTSPPAAGDGLVLVSQGTAKTQRIGNKIRVYQMRLTMIVSLPTSVVGDVMRIILYRDTQPNGTAPTVTQILEQATLYSRQAMDYTDRIRILKDRFFNLNPQVGSVTVTTPILYHAKMSHKCNVDIKYSGITGAGSELQSDNFNYMIISASGVAQLSGQARVYYRDG